jgi:hypothetical protein
VRDWTRQILVALTIKNLTFKSGTTSFSSPCYTPLCGGCHVRRVGTKNMSLVGLVGLVEWWRGDRDPCGAFMASPASSMMPTDVSPCSYPQEVHVCFHTQAEVRTWPSNQRFKKSLATILPDVTPSHGTDSRRRQLSMICNCRFASID